MAIEFSSSDPTTIKQLREIAATDANNVLSLPISPMEGKEILTLVIENYTSLSVGTVALILALKGKLDLLKITKNGLEIRGAAKEKALRGD